MLTQGQLLGDRYRLTRLIAVGGMGEVWEATDTRLDRQVGIKILKSELCDNAEFLHRFRTEARMTASLNHPGIAAVHDYGETSASPDGQHRLAYLVMELVDGIPLATILATEGRISADRTLDILEQAGYALQAAHERGYVHRDVKPGNILVTPTGSVKLTDFGIAKAADSAPVTRSGLVMGTAHYIAPEQAIGRDAEPASDVYALAVVGYECLAGRRPFLSENAVTVAVKHINEAPPPLPPDVPPGARALIEVTLVKDSRQRYQNGAEFAGAVAAVRAGLPLPPPSHFTLAQQLYQPAAQPMSVLPMPLPMPQVSSPAPGITPMNTPSVPGNPAFIPAPASTVSKGTPIRRSRPIAWLIVILLAAAVIGLMIWGLYALFSSTHQASASVSENRVARTAQLSGWQHSQVIGVTQPSGSSIRPMVAHQQTLRARDS